MRDSDGRTTQVTQALEPDLVELTFQTDPGNLFIDVGGASVEGPITMTSWRGWHIEIAAYDQAAGTDDVWYFDGWHHGGESVHMIATPEESTTYTAGFKFGIAPPRPPPLQPLTPPPTKPGTAQPNGTKPGAKPASKLLLGGDGSDNINGTSGPDHACGRGGNDVIDLGGGDDIGYGGECGTIAGAVTAKTRDRHDVLRGGSGRDRLFGNEGNDVLLGGAGADTSAATAAATS